MSTKIYNAYKVNGGFSTVQLVRSKLRKLNLEHLERQVLKAGWDKNVGEFFKEKTYSEHHTLGLLVQNEFFRIDVRKDLQAANFHSPLHYIMGSTATLFERKGKFYIIIHGVLDATSLVEEGLLTDFHYQNQTDPFYDDLDLTPEAYKKAEREYKRRDKIWTEIFGKDNPLGLAWLSGYDMNI